MSIPLDSECFQCHLRRNLETARKLGSEEQATAFAKELMQLYIALSGDIVEVVFDMIYDSQFC